MVAPGGGISEQAPENLRGAWSPCEQSLAVIAKQCSLLHEISLHLISLVICNKNSLYVFVSL